MGRSIKGRKESRTLSVAKTSGREGKKVEWSQEIPFLVYAIMGKKKMEMWEFCTAETWYLFGLKRKTRCGKSPSRICNVTK